MAHQYSIDELNHYWSLARRMASRWCDHDADAQDAAQEVIVRLLGQREKPFHDAGWMYVVTRRVCHAMRKAKIRSGEAERMFAAVESQHVMDTTCTVMQAAAVLQALPARDRALLEMVARGHKAREIAVVFGCKTRDVGQMVSRARRKARRLRDRKTNPESPP